MSESLAISIILPVYNQENYIAQCLESILSQKNVDFEVIAINDGSSDNSLRIMRDYANRDARIRVFDQENMGVGNTRNRGIELAKGRFVIFCDPDDYYPDDDVLSSLADAGIEHNALAVGGCFSSFNERTGKINTEYKGLLKGYVFDSPGWVEYEDYQFDYGFHRFIFDRNMIVKYNIRFPDYVRYQDPPFFVRAMYAAKRFYALDKVVYRYRRCHTSVKWSDKKRLDLAKALRDVLIFSNSHDLRELHSLTVSRILDEFMKVLNKNPGGPTSLYILAWLSGCINPDFLDREQIDRVELVDGLVILKPFMEKAERYEMLQREIKTLKRKLKPINKSQVTSKNLKGSIKSKLKSFLK